MTELLSLSDIARRAAMSPRTLREHLGEIKHVRMRPRGKVWIRWDDFQTWLESKSVAVRQDDDVLDLLRRIAG